MARDRIHSYNRPFVAAALEDGSWAKIARAMGAAGIRVNSPEEVSQALKRAADRQMNQGKTRMLEIMGTHAQGDPFRRDALSKPVRYRASPKTGFAQTISIPPLDAYCGGRPGPPGFSTPRYP